MKKSMCGVKRMLSSVLLLCPQVTASFALSIVTLLTGLWVAFVEFLPIVVHFFHYGQKHQVRDFLVEFLSKMGVASAGQTL